MMREILVMDCEGGETFWTALKSNHKILFATTAREGLNMLSENIGIIFLNLRLPDMDGLEVLRLIKKAYPLTAVIIITSFGTEETCIEAFRKGARDYIKKPLKADEILQKIMLLMSESDVSQRRHQVSLSTGTVRYGYYPDVPSHLVSGVLEVRDFITQNYSESLSLAAACKMASLSKTYFCRFFKRITGHSLRRYHHVVKIWIAEELLQDKRLSVTDVALRLGYDDSNYFSTIYKKITGVSPRQWQASYQNLFRDKRESRTMEVTHETKSSPDQPESKHRNMPREWQASYQNLYREKKESETVGITQKTKSSFIHKRITGISPRCRKMAVRGLGKIKKINEEWNNTLEYLEP